MTQVRFQPISILLFISNTPSPLFTFAALRAWTPSNGLLSCMDWPFGQ